MGQVFSAFVLGYALCQIPGGWLSDRWGARRILTLAVIWWSIFTALTALAPALPIVNMIGILGSLILVRFLIGVGEAAALPNFNRVVASWFGPHERGLGIGIAISGIGIGSALTPPYGLDHGEFWMADSFLPFRGSRPVYGRTLVFFRH